MADKKFYSNIDLVNASVIKNGGFETLTTDPVSPTNGQMWVNTTDDVLKVRIDGVTYVLSSEAYVLSQINALERSQGGYDASGGLLPDNTDKTRGDLTTVFAGDQWVITNGGTITGIVGDDVLQVGDKLEFLGGAVGTASNWVGISRNEPDGGGSGGAVDRQVDDLVAGVPLTISSSSVTNIYSFQVYNSAGELIEVTIEKTANANERNVTSNVSLANAVFEMTGV